METVQYNTFDSLDDFPYNCVAYLMQNSEIVWKLLYYSDADAWKKQNLTSDQKRSMIFDGLMQETDARLFLSCGINDAWNVEACQLRISVVDATPVNAVLGRVSIGMEIYPHFRVSHMSNYKTRSDMISKELIKVFNGAEIGGLGKLYFDASKNPSCKMTTIGRVPYVGKGLVFCNWISSNAS